jgi:hypothetical protein
MVWVKGAVVGGGAGVVGAIFDREMNLIGVGIYDRD